MNDLSIIWGIPYYYRQFGYSYAIQGEVFRSLPAWNIPEPANPNMDALRLRRHPNPGALLPMETARLAFYAERPAGYWEYLIQWARRPIHLVENAFTGEALRFGNIRCCSPDTNVGRLDKSDGDWSRLRQMIIQGLEGA